VVINNKFTVHPKISDGDLGCTINVLRGYAEHLVVHHKHRALFLKIFKINKKHEFNITL
jgi:hypothetical protein